MSCISELAAPAEYLSSTERRFSFAEDTIAVVCEKVRGHGHQVHEIEAASATAEYVCVMAGCRFSHLLHKIQIFVGMSTS